MPLQKAVQEVFLQLSTVIKELSDKEYIFQSDTLSGASIGQHLRHIIEMFICLEEGYETGLVNYENRRRDESIATNRMLALSLLHSIGKGLGKPDKALTLQASFSSVNSGLVELATNYKREIAYNLEHTIHHMALIKIGVRELTDIQLPNEFGVASSTMKYKNECAQ